MWRILKNELIFLLRNRVIKAITAGFIILLLLTIYLGSLQTETQSETYKAAKSHLREQWESLDAVNPHSAAHYGTYVFKPANLLSSLDEGVRGTTGNVLRVEGHVQNEIAHSEASQMQFVSKFGKLKSSLILQFIIPLLLIFLAFRSISAEKESGRLKFLLLQGASKSNILWAKLLSVWLFGLLLLFLTVALYVLINFNSINTDTFKRLSLFFTSYSVYYFIISRLTVFFSAIWQNATTALTTMLGIWILWSIFLPNIMMSTIEKLYELPSRDEFQSAMKEDRSEGINGHDPKDARAKALKEKILSEYNIDSLSALPINFDGIVMQADEEYGNMVWDKHFGAIRDITTKQKRAYQLAAIINPFISLQNTSMGFAANDNYHHQAFLLQAEHYRRDLIKTLNDEHAYGGSKTGNWDWQADNDFYSSIPDFTYRPLKFNEVFFRYRLDLIILMCWVILTCLFVTLSSNKMKIA
ncbi:hypothetical protein GCM10011506_45360 [Marivirga lumbricoides]|uniref:ABC transporter permease n=1 Tax=Marivirga lumbricoides TaxID=1046115 RepID=A0ABQ1N8R3_9BACT|nr:hypothetical protein GCM10011506_45360 [Marivirga lumbricoides]